MHEILVRLRAHALHRLGDRHDHRGGAYSKHGLIAFSEGLLMVYGS